MSDQREHLSLANVNVAGALQFQQKFARWIGIGLMVLGGLLSLTIIGAVIGIPLIILGLLAYFIGPKFFGAVQKAVTPPPTQPPRADHRLVVRLDAGQSRNWTIRVTP